MSHARFRILRIDGDHLLLDSETRPGEIAHSLEKVGKDWTCTCEFKNEGGNPTCKHIEWVGGRTEQELFLFWELDQTRVALRAAGNVCDQAKKIAKELLDENAELRGQLAALTAQIAQMEATGGA